MEAILLLAAGGVAAEEIARAVSTSVEEVLELVDQLDARYRAQGHGIRVQRHGGTMCLVTAPETSEAVRRFSGRERPARLSAAALDTLTIVAYRQPVTRASIEAIRGVGSDHVLMVLLNLGLIEEVGRAESIGRPVLYSTTAGFLESLGLASLAELPPLPGDAAG